MRAERDRKLNLSDPGHDAAGDELEQLLQDGEAAEHADGESEDAGSDSFLERFPAGVRKRRKPD